MDNRIGIQTPRTLRLAAGIFLLALALPGAALAFKFKSAYTSITMPGEFDSGEQWDTSTHPLSLVSDYVWQGVINVTKNGKFKFAADNSWNVNWGLGQEVSTVPTEDMGPLARGGSDISLKLAAGKYRFVFFEDTETFSVLPASTVPPSYSSVQLVGNFNDDGVIATGTMAPQGNGVWKATVSNLSYGATVRVNADGTIFGAHSAQGAVLSEMPATVALYGTTETVLQAQGGTFVFTMDFRSNQLSVVQTATNAFHLGAAGADGTFACSTNLPGQNLTDAGDNWWSGDFQVGQDSFTLRFVGRDKDGVPGRWWGFPAGTTVTTLPSDGVLTAADTPGGAAFATFNTGAGDYTFRFNPQSGSYTVRKRALSNLFANASFEQLDGNGNPVNWGLYHAGNAPSSIYDAHSGTNSAVLNRLYEDWDNLGNIDQSVALKDKAGLPFRVSASFRCGGSAWHGDTVRIIIEWKDSRDTLLSEESTEVLNLSPAWQTVALDTTVPDSNVTAHVLFKYDGARVGETVLIDDAFAGISASRTQNFDAWGRHDKFEKIDPDWSASSAQTILNAAATVPGGVIISRYIESVGNTKAIEIYNGTSTAINLKTTPYYLQQYDNGSDKPTVTIPLTNGTIPAGKCFAVTRTFPAGSKYPPDNALRQFGAIGGLSTRILRTDALTFNGDDVIVLRKGSSSGRIVDRVGQVGANASGSLWSRMATDHTLVRNGTVTNGYTSSNLSAPFDLTEWTVLDNGEYGDLGAHAFIDPDAGYLPSGYSLLLDTDATLTTPALEGGIGDIAFLARAQGSTNASDGDLQLAIETAPDEYSTNWSTVATVKIPLTQTEFTRYECSAGTSADTVVRFRHVGDGTTNRVRLDDIEIGRAFRIKRTENFAGWTDPAYRTDGLHSIAQWTLNGRVDTNGVSATLAGNLPVDSGYVQTPTFDGGIGEISFTLGRPTTDDGVQVTLYTSGDGGATWDEVQTFDFPSSAKDTFTNLSAWVYIPSNGCARFECAGGTADAILDNISVGMPIISREVNFDDFAPDTAYKSYVFNGWTITETSINNSENAWSGNSGILRDAGIIASPYIENVGSLSFMYRMGVSSGDDKARLKVEVSADNKTWKTLADSLAGTNEWQSYAYAFPTNESWHYARISQSASYTSSSHRRIFLDDISLNDFAPIPSVSFSSTLDPAYPTVREPFRLIATAYPRNGADILSVTGYVKYTRSGRFTTLPMTDEGTGDWTSETQPGRNGGESIITYATVWYGGVGVVEGNPGYAVTNVSTLATTVTVSSVKAGEVWINEFSYAELKDIDNWYEDHEFIEICGKAGTVISNWTIQLAYALSSDIAANSNQVIYASYTITNDTVLADDTGSGYGFWLLADKNDTAFPNRKGTLTVLDPIDNSDDWGDWDDWGDDDWGDGGSWGDIHSHIHDGAGVIRLLNQYGGVMQSISYGAYAESSERISQTQGLATDTNAISLHGEGGKYSDFSWTKLGFTPGALNDGQTLDGSISVNLMPIWHDPTLSVTTRLQGSFFLFNPENAPQSAAVQVFYAYTNSDFPSYGSLGGTLYHRPQGTGAWRQADKENDFTGNDDQAGHAYFAFQALARYTYQRRDTMEYVIAASASGYADTFLGTEDGTTSTAYETLAEAQMHPFTHYFPVADHIIITNYAFADDGSFVIQTTGDDSLDRLREFNVLATSDMTIPVTNWSKLEFIRDGVNESDTFTIPDPPPAPAHFAIQPVR